MKQKTRNFLQAFRIFILPNNKNMANIQLTQELVKSLFDYKDGKLYWKVQRGKRGVIGTECGTIGEHRNEKRCIIIINYKQFKRSRLVFLYHNGYLPEVVDHENNNTLDDRIENLRAATQSLNNKNTSSRKNSTSKYLGVCWISKESIWVSKITHNNKTKYIGRFKSEQLAALAYNKFAVLYNKEFANLNIITV